MRRAPWYSADVCGRVLGSVIPEAMGGTRKEADETTSSCNGLCKATASSLTRNIDGPVPAQGPVKFGTILFNIGSDSTPFLRRRGSP